MCVNNCGAESCGCDSAQLPIPIGPPGPMGPMGPTGLTGQDGENGRSIVSESYDVNTGVLTLTFSDATTYSTGDLRGADGADGNPSTTLGADVYTDLSSTTYATYAEYVGSDLALFQNLMHPRGLISMFSASLSNFDASGYGIDFTGSGGFNLLGWAICKGSTYAQSDGTGNILSPDLRGRFVVGQKAADADFGSMAQVGGTKTHTHDGITLIDDNIPSHTHGLSAVTVDNHIHDFSGTTDGGKARIDTATNDDDSFPTRLLSGAKDNLVSGDESQQPFSHTHTFSGTTDNQSAEVGLTGNTDANTPNGVAFDTTSAENLVPYYTIVYLIKI